MKFDVSGIGSGELDELRFVEDLDELSKEICEKGAQSLASHTKSALSGHSRTGSLVRSIGTGKAKYIAKYGGYHASVTFRGKDSKGVRNGLKAAQLEYGNSRQPASPFVDRAMNSAEAEITALAERTISGRLGK